MVWWNQQLCLGSPPQLIKSDKPRMIIVRKIGYLVSNSHFSKFLYNNYLKIIRTQGFFAQFAANPFPTSVNASSSGLSSQGQP